MAEERNIGIFIATGRKGSGKTFLTVKEIEQYINDEAGVRNGRRGIIFDVNREKSYTQFPTIQYFSDIEDAWERTKHIRTFPQKTIRRIIPYRRNGIPMDANEQLQVVIDLAQHFKDGVILLEDINKYLIDSKSQDVIGMLTQVRHNKTDIYIHLQSLSPVTTRMWQNVNYIRFHHQTDSIDRYKDRIPDYTLMRIAQLIVDAEFHKGSQHEFYCIWIDVIRSKLMESTSVVIEGMINFALKYDNEIKKMHRKRRTGNIEDIRNELADYIWDIRHYFTKAAMPTMDSVEKWVKQLYIP